LLILVLWDWIFSPSPAVASIGLTEFRDDMWRKSVTAGEGPGLSLSVTEWSRRGLPCVMLHGFGDAGCVWNHLAIRLAPRFHAAAMDLRGHGDSDWDPETRYDAQTFTADLTSAAAAFGFERMILIGHSLGADVAIRFAADNAARVAALVIVDFGPELDERGIDEILRSFAATPPSFETQEDYADWLIARRPLADPTLLRHFARQSLRQASPGDWRPKADAALASHSQISRIVASDGRYRDPDLWPMLRRVTCPSLVVRGNGSGVLPADVASRMSEQALWDGRLATIGAAGHAVMMDNPTEFCGSVIDFLAKIAA
jgi:pimeloyl-ACP methyl ester carboxylesterase